MRFTVPLSHKAEMVSIILYMTSANFLKSVGFEVLTMVVMKSTILEV
jgi:hypothetical protein